MLYICEFEIFKGTQSVCAIPCNDMGAGTFGDDFNDAVESAADWLMCMVDDSLMNGTELPPVTFGHEPENGGKVIAIAVSRSLDCAS